MRNTPTEGDRRASEGQGDHALQNANQDGRQSAPRSRSKDTDPKLPKQSTFSEDQTATDSVEKGRLSTAYQGSHQDGKVTSASGRAAGTQENSLAEYQRQVMLLEQRNKQVLSWARQDYQMQLMLLEQQNKKRELIPRQEMDPQSAVQNSASESNSNLGRRDPISRTDHPTPLSHTPPQASKRKRTESEPELHERSPTSGAPSPQRMYRSSNAQARRSDSGPSKSPECAPPAATNGRIYRCQMKDGQREVEMKFIFPQHTEESFKKQARDQRSVVIPTHRVVPPGAFLFKHISDLGGGHDGAVDEVEPADEQHYFPGRVYARKVLTLGSRQHGAIMTNELVRLESARALSHPHLPIIVMTYEEEVGFHVLRYGILMNPLPKYTLSSFLKNATNTDRFREQLLKDVKKWIGCLASALSYVHAKDVVHGGINPSALLLKKGEIFFTEFAISNHFKGTHMLTKGDPDPNIGEDIYRAPEVEMQQPFGPKADVFSLGCVYIEMMATASGPPLGERPPPHSRQLSQRQALLADLDAHGRLPSPFLREFIKCCRSMILYDPDARPSAFQATRSIFELHEKHSGGGLRVERECECLDPWRGNGEDCKLLM